MNSVTGIEQQVDNHLGDPGNLLENAEVSKLNQSIQPLQTLANICQNMGAGDATFIEKARSISNVIQTMIDPKATADVEEMNEMLQIICLAQRQQAVAGAVSQITDAHTAYEHLIAQIQSGSYSDPKLVQKITSDNMKAWKSIDQCLDLYTELNAPSTVNAPVENLAEIALTSLILNHLLASDLSSFTSNLLRQVQKDIDLHKKSVNRAAEEQVISGLLTQGDPSFIEVSLSDGLPGHHPNDRTPAAVSAKLYYKVDQQLKCISFSYALSGSENFKWPQESHTLAAQDSGSSMQDLYSFINTLTPGNNTNELTHTFLKLVEVGPLNQLPPRVLLALARSKT